MVHKDLVSSESAISDEIAVLVVKLGKLTNRKIEQKDESRQYLLQLIGPTTVNMCCFSVLMYSK